MPVVSFHGPDQHNLSRPSRDAIPAANASLTALRLYFRNIKAGVPFDAGALSLDYSLQLQNGIANWALANPSGPQGAASGGAPSAAAGRKRFDTSHGVNVKPVGRDG